MRTRRSFRTAAAVFGLYLLVGPRQSAAAMDFLAFFNSEPTRVQAVPAAQTHIQKATRVETRKTVHHEAAKAPRMPRDRETKVVAETKSTLPLFGVVSIADQHISIYNNDGLVTRSPVSTGMPGHGTPKGIFTIIGRERYHRSNIYSGAPMPFMQRITWSGIAMHVGVVPGHPASHGCIRLPADFAAKLWGMTRIGERIVVSPAEVFPAAFSHDSLPEPKIYISGPGKEKPVYGPPVTGEDEASSARLNPRQYAEQLRAKAVADTLAASKAMKEAQAAEKAAQEEAAAAARELAAAESTLSEAQVKTDAADEAYLLATAKAHALQEEASLANTSLKEEGRRNARFGTAIENAATARASAATAKITSATAAVEAMKRVEAARSAAAVKEAELSTATERLTVATAAVEAASKAEADARRRLAPLSVLVSKKDRRVYVRQGLSPLFDAPIVVKDPDKPLGSHLFIATAGDESANGVKWSVLTMPGQVASATEALERIEMTPELRSQLGERLWVGGSIIISGQSPSSETGADGTDLTVKLREVETKTEKKK